MWTAGRILIVASDYRAQFQACALAANSSMYVNCTEEQFWCVL